MKDDTQIHLIDLAPDPNAPRYTHKCQFCGVEFVNILKECDCCCVCEIRIMREEWD